MMIIKKKYLENTVNKKFLPIIDITNKKIILNKNISFINQALIIISNQVIIDNRQSTIDNRQSTINKNNILYTN